MGMNDQDPGTGAAGGASMTRLGPPATGSSPGSGDESSPASKNHKLDLLRQLRAEIQDIRLLLTRVRDGAAMLHDYADYLARNKTEIDELFVEIREVMPDLYVAGGDNVRHIENLWRQMLCSPILATPAEPLPAEKQVKELALCIGLCREMVALLGFLTIPARLNDWLTAAWAGYLLSFHDLFGDELPEREDRQRLLGFLANAPGLIRGGIVDAKTGLIYPYHQSRWARYGICAGLFLFFVAATVGTGLLGTVKAVQDVSGLVSPWRFVAGWGLVLAGVLVHFVIDRAKDGGGSASVPLGHFSSAVDARAGMVLMKMLLMLGCYFGLLFLGGSGNATSLNFFLVGYSLDSFGGIFTASMDKKAVALGAALKGKLGA